MSAINLAELPELSQIDPAVLMLTESAREERRLLGESYLRTHADRDPGPLIPREVGFAVVRDAQSSIVREVVEEARSMVAARGGSLVRTKESLDYLTEAADYDESSAAVRFAWSPEVLAPIVRYFGMLPILNDIFVTRASAKELLRKSSHMFHADNSLDITQMKILFHLTDVAPDGGPFNALPAHLSDRVKEARTEGGRIMDEEVVEIVGAGQTIASTGPVGTYSYCDTTRCLHFGGRPPAPGRPIRELLFIRYILPTSRYAKGGKKGGLRLARRPDQPLWNAFIGAELV